MIEAVNVQDFVGVLDKWAREQERFLSLHEMEYVGAFRRIFKGSNHLTPVGMMLVWSQATRSVAEKIPGLMLPTESQHATFERMASAVFPAAFAAEATRLVRNEPKRASDPTMERIADALECLALNTVMMNKGFATDNAFGDIAIRTIGRVQANVEARK